MAQLGTERRTSPGSARFFDQQVPEDGSAGPIQYHSHQPLLELVVFKFGHCLTLHQDIDNWTAASDRDRLLRSGNQIADWSVRPGRKIPRAGLEVEFLDNLERDLARPRGGDDDGIVSAIVEVENESGRDRQISGSSAGLQLDADRSIQVAEPRAVANYDARSRIGASQVSHRADTSVRW